MIKNYLIIKKWAIFILFLIIFKSFMHMNLFASNESGIEINNKNLSYTFRPIINKFSYCLDESIILIIDLEANSQIEKVNSICDGFVENQAPYINCGNIEINIQVANKTYYYVKYTVNVELTNKVQLEASIYGIIRNDKVYINCNSFFCAEDIYYSEILTKDKKK